MSTPPCSTSTSKPDSQPPNRIKPKRVEPKPNQTGLQTKNRNKQNKRQSQTTKTTYRDQQPTILQTKMKTKPTTNNQPKKTKMQKDKNLKNKKLNIIKKKKKKNSFCGPLCGLVEDSGLWDEGRGIGMAWGGQRSKRTGAAGRTLSVFGFRFFFSVFWRSFVVLFGFLWVFCGLADFFGCLRVFLLGFGGMEPLEAPILSTFKLLERLRWGVGFFGRAFGGGARIWEGFLRFRWA